MKCRHCLAELRLPLIDLGTAPPSNAYLSAEDLHRAEVWYPLRVLVCTRCWLAQTEDVVRADALFAADYAYFSSVSSTWTEHARRFAASIIPRLGLDTHSLVVEVAANDGYLLRHFVAAGIPCMGIEPTASTATAAEGLGIPILREFFSAQTAARLAGEGQKADLIIGNNVYAHVPDINDFTLGLQRLLKPDGSVVLEFPHLQRLIEGNQFDTIYHEHFSYLSLGTTRRIFAASGLRVWDVEMLSTHGGSLRVFGCHVDDPRPESEHVEHVLRAERAAGLEREETYPECQRRAERAKRALLGFLLEQQRLGKRVAGYGAAAKGNTLLNFAGVRADLLPFVCDAAPSKQGRFLPGSRIPIRHPELLAELHPESVLILPWNIAPEIVRQQQHALARGGAFYVAIPELRRIEDTP